jgi:hypothetical protein
MNAADDDDDAEELRRRKGSIGPAQDEELLAKMLALLTREQRQCHQNTVDFATEAQACEASVAFRLDLAKTYLQGLPQREEAIQIGKHIRDEKDRVDEALLTKRLALLSDEQRQHYQNKVDFATEAHACEASLEFRLGLTKTYLQGLPPRAEAMQISDYIKDESKRVDRDNDRARQEIIRAKLAGIDPAVRDHPAQNQPDQKRPAENQPNYDQPSPEHADPMQGMRPSVAERDYTELKKTHEQVAQRLSAEAHSPTTPLTKEQLKDISKRFAEVREAHDLQRSSAELSELKDLAQVQKQSREKLYRAPGPEPDPQQKQERELLGRQHLAERVGVEGRWLGQDLRRKKLPGAERCEQEARHAHYAGRQFHQQRQNLKADPVRALAHVIQEQDQQKQAAQQHEALRSGRTVTDGQGANAPENSRPENSKKAVNRKAHADKARDGKGNAAKQGSHKGPTRPGNARGGGGRSR